ncbi:TMhelix containing protein [Vibrio phage 1.188.A._10N.286.51.A6]|uniref:TMhelix containing protein n=5 Tax=Mukerjeevirus TaxID=2733146 RepID=A0A2I7REJ9_9CAUD|nr:TMhelix containing protein [Vibrio phage 1.169.O._10N.261.52.B1]YP_009817543.1 TMhelix containing protein [Vibrio phage 1.188.A._10N.286.51.A6]YP_009817765.1 TMhelix containing protein [Vibrio phage 1.261.O._10N.286.51.A7]AUR93738.1 TMhelix containing protein [Vibrio phage 1.188.B._10N.286.51.A6]AUR93824.1 TMhelix containing protein [Vibrio phage 1.188.C._10N.286.51.A6]AUR92063.1 TMhelix containing protein [Vibrio phage 1.169.O._10N.261.52.B1]AUR93652.1 TMhelix containing protein [Vibrio p
MFELLQAVMAFESESNLLHLLGVTLWALTAFTLYRLCEWAHS